MTQHQQAERDALALDKSSKALLELNPVET